MPLVWEAGFNFALNRKPHRGKGRRVQNGQKIHASVLFKHGYRPQAVFAKDYQQLKWGEIIGLGDPHTVGWTENLKDILEMDLYDCTAGGSLISQLKDVIIRANAAKHILDRLYFIAYFGTSLLFVSEYVSQILLASKRKTRGRCPSWKRTENSKFF